MLQEDFSNDVSLDIVENSDDTPSHSGCKSLKVPGVSSGSLGYMLAQPLNEEDTDTEYQISYWVRLDAGTTTCTITTAFTNPAPGYESSEITATVGDNGNDWFQISYTGQVASTDDSAINVFFGGCDGAVYVDDFDVQSASATMPTIPNSRFNPFVDPAWVVTPDDVTTIYYDDTNDGALGAVSQGLHDTANAGVMTLSQEVTENWDSNAAYWVSVWLRLQADDEQCTAQMYVDALAGDGPQDADGEPVSLTTEWSQVWYSLYPTGSMDVRLGLRFEGCTQIVEVDDIEVQSAF